MALDGAAQTAVVKPFNFANGLLAGLVIFDEVNQLNVQFWLPLVERDAKVTFMVNR
jgi:hypothetical protein